MYEITLPAKVENLDEVLEFVDKLLDEHDCSVRTQMQLDVAVEELFVNIAHYAYTPKIGNATLQISFAEEPETVYITFIDSGMPYDPLKREDPDITLSVEERQIGGLGIYMVKKSMDEVKYEYKDGKNVLRLKKVL